MRQKCQAKAASGERPDGEGQECEGKGAGRRFEKRSRMRKTSEERDGWEGKAGIHAQPSSGTENPAEFLALTSE